jgi:HK97 family phage prohead protease
MNKEVRSLDFEIRAEETGNEERAGRLTGTPIVFNQVTDLGWIREVIEPGALDDTDLKDVRFLIGHDTSGIPLARSRNNNASSTMQLSVNENGMDIRVDLDIENNPRAKELYSAVKRGDISGMSFMFTVDKDSWEDLESEQPLRRITAISRVFEVSAVTFPAYEGTSLEAASEDSALESARASLESARKQLAEDRAAQAEAERRTALIARLEKLTKEGSEE